MDRLKQHNQLIRPTLVVLTLLLAASCTEKKGVAPEGTPEFAKSWTTWGLYRDETLSADERALVLQAEPAGGSGETALSFARDFDGDGRRETVAYGWFTREETSGNFVLVTRGTGADQVVLLLQEFDNPPAVTVFTLKNDGSLYFGGGIVSGEVLWKLEWPGNPRVISLLQD